jgi:hypothetical protein
MNKMCRVLIVLGLRPRCEIHHRLNLPGDVAAIAQTSVSSIVSTGSSAARPLTSRRHVACRGDFINRQ